VYRQNGSTSGPPRSIRPSRSLVAPDPVKGNAIRSLFCKTLTVDCAGSPLAAIAPQRLCSNDGLSMVPRLRNATGNGLKPNAPAASAPPHLKPGTICQKTKEYNTNRAAFWRLTGLRSLQQVNNTCHAARTLLQVVLPQTNNFDAFFPQSAFYLAVALPIPCDLVRPK
jgi:hypothetical protein